MKKLLLIPITAIALFANNVSNSDDDIDKLLNKLQAFQQKVMSKNVTLASDKEIKKMDKQIKLLRKKIQYLGVNSAFERSQENTKDVLKKITENLYYLSKKVYENSLKIYLPYRNSFKMNNKTYYIIGKQDIMNIDSAYINRKDNFMKLKKEYFITKQKNDTNSYKNLVYKLINYINRTNFQKILRSSGNDEYVTLKKFSHCKLIIDKNAKMFIIKGCKVD